MSPTSITLVSRFTPTPLKQGIHDGFLAPYKVIKVHLDVDMEGYRPRKGKTDTHGYAMKTVSTTRKSLTGVW